MHINGLRWLAVVAVIAVSAAAVGLVPQVQAQAPTYLVCSDITWPPFEWTDPQGNYVGFDLDVMRSIAILEGYNITIEHRDWDILWEDVPAGRCDIGASGITITAERDKIVDFSDPYYSSDQAVIVRLIEADGERVPEYNIVTALSQGHTVGAQVGTTGAAWVKENLIDKGVDVKLKEYATYPLAVLDLINGNIDAVIQDKPASEASVAAQPTEITIVGIIITGEQFGYMVPEGDPKGILPLINDGMKQMQASGAWENLVKAYIGTAQDKVEAAWSTCSSKLLQQKDVDGFAACMAEEVAK